MKRTKKKQPTIMACDPSMASGFGWVIIDRDGDIIAMSCIKTKPVDKKQRIRKSDDFMRRISEINTALLSDIKRYNVSIIVTEAPHGSQSAVSAKSIGAVTAILQTISDCLNIPLESYSEGDAKTALLGKASGSKEAVKKEIDELYDVEWAGLKYFDEAIADSLAVFNVAKKQSAVLKFLLKNENRQ